ncbi:MAG: hypothetical protein NVS3B25_28960 [Hymenobacter sp.]
MLVQLGRGLVVVPVHGGSFNRAVQAFDRTGGPGMDRLGETVLEAVLGADAVEEVAKGPGLVAQVAERDAVVGQHRVHPVRPLGQHPAQKVGDDQFGGLRLQFGKSRFAGAVNGPKQIRATFFGLALGKIDMQIADGVVFELLFGHAQPAFG